jgi:hypothetical protein
VTEEELAEKRKEFRDSEVQKKIDNFNEGGEDPKAGGGQAQAKAVGKRPSKKDLGGFAWTLIISQAIGLVFFSSLFIMSYIPKTKFIVTKILP